MSHVRHSTLSPYSGITIRSGEGAILTTVAGQRLIDFTSGFGVAALGYGHPAVRSSVDAQLGRLSHGIPSVVRYEGDSVAADAICEVLGDEDAAAVLTTSGAEAVEVAMKIAVRVTGRTRFVVLSGAYHGQSVGALRVTAQKQIVEPLRSMATDAPDVLPCPVPASPAPSDAIESASIQAIELLGSWLLGDDSASRDIAAVIVEPMQNFAGYRELPRAFCKSVTELCRAAGVLLIADEIFTGFGRCGNWSISESVGLTPDIRCFGKAMTGGVPGGACVASVDLVDSLFPTDGAPLHAPTFYNSPIVAAAIAAAIETIRAEELLSRSILIGDRIQAELRHHVGVGRLVKGIRGRGAAQALVFSESSDSLTRSAVHQVTSDLLAGGVLALNSGAPWGNVVTLCPPLVISDSDLSTGIGRVSEALSRVEGAWRNGA